MARAALHAIAFADPVTSRAAQTAGGLAAAAARRLWAEGTYPAADLALAGGANIVGWGAALLHVFSADAGLRPANPPSAMACYAAFTAMSVRARCRSVRCVRGARSVTRHRFR